MKTIQIAFYKGWYSKNIVSRIVAGFTFSVYSHVELVIDEYSYSARTSTRGVTKKINQYEDLSLWEIIEIEVSEDVVIDILKFFNDTENTRYDWLGIFFFHLLPFNIESPKKYYCSEWVAQALTICYPFKIGKIQMTPKALYKKLNKILY